MNLRIEIRGFGVFEVKPTRAKPKARNPRTNEIVYVPPRSKIPFGRKRPISNRE
ncbi:HU family DNA-binding protein [bacterium]|nr:HU family DNA-binding protein [bacterium]MBU1873731.1 HU family DNA-binding protein [bacterium]